MPEDLSVYLPDMFTFLSYPGMPPHNNDTERAIRDGIIPQRNSRHKTMNARGRKTLSMLLIPTMKNSYQNSPDILSQ